MRRQEVLAATILAVLAAISPAMTRAQSQATTGVIEGTVFDPSGAVLPGVRVTLTHTATNFEQALTTDGRGRFRGVLLPLGPYRATAQLEGFATLVREGVQLTVGATLNLDLTLQISATQEEIVVTGEATGVDTSRTENAVTITREALQGLPNNGRNFLELSKLTPGVAVTQGPDGDELTINGQKGIQNNISVDGADFNNPFFGEQRGGQRPAFFFNLDAVQEFAVVPDGAPAEFGRSSGGFVNVVTKSGTNQRSGTAHLFFKNDALSARAERTDGSLEPEFDADQTQVGFTLGGPVRRDRLFYFVAVDVQEGDSTKQNDPDRIPVEVVAALSSLGSSGENLPITRTNDAKVFLGKLDWRAADRHLATLRFNATDAEQENGTFDVDSWGRSANAQELDESLALSGSLVTTVTSNLLNEARFQWAREDRPRPYDGPLITGTDRPLPDIAFDFGRRLRFGQPFFIPVDYYDIRNQVVDNVTWIHGEHTVKGGIEFNHTSAFQTFRGFGNGRFIFSSTEGFLNYLANPGYVECSDGSASPAGVCPPGTTITGPVLLYLQQAGVGGLTVDEAGTQDIVQREPAIFLQDTWQPTGRLTIQAGLRWEAQIQPDPITPPEEVFYAPFIGQVRNGQRFPSNGKIPSDYDLWQPRLAVAWDPQGDGKSVLRASAGVYVARIPGLVLASTRSTNGSRGQTLFRNSALTPILGPPPPVDQLIPQSEIGSPFLPDVFVFDEDFRNPRTEAYSLSYEREVAEGWFVSGKYNNAKTERLTRFVNRNDPLLGSPWSTGLGPDGSNGINNLTVVESTAESLYQGFTVGVEKRYGGRFQVGGFYTYSKDRSDDDNERDPFTFQYARVTDLDAEWGFSNRDQRDRLNLWGLWRGPRGIDVNLRYSYRSPQPISLTEDGTVANTPQDRINRDGTVTRRNLGRKDNKFSSLDLRVSKEFAVGGDRRLEAILEVFNLTNSTNFRVPEDKNLVFNFDGTVQSGLGDPRQVQLGLRFAF
jgi:hypothetical protein